MALTKTPIELSSTPSIVDGGNATAITIDSSENVGIGTTSPASRLTLKAGDNSYAGGFRLEGTDETSALAITHVNGDNYFSGNATDDHLVLTGTGNLVVGGTSLNAASSVGFTAGGQIRQVFASGVANDSLFGAISGVSNGFQIIQDTSNNQSYKFHNGGTPSVTIDSSGNVGIGTQSMSSTYGRLTVAGTGISITPDTSAKMQIGRYNAANPYSYIKAGSTSSGFKFTSAADNSDIVTITNAGKMTIDGTSGGANGLMLELANTGTSTNHYSQMRFTAGTALNYLWGANQNSTAWGGASSLNIQSSSGAIAFFTAGSTLRMRIHETSGNIDIPNGNLSFAAGHGIDFSATANAAGASSELLDDYEEGTWTPTLAGYYGTYGTTFTQGTRNGVYTKIGNLVTLGMEISSAGVAAANNGDIITITGLPFNISGYGIVGSHAHTSVASRAGGGWTSISTTKFGHLGNNGTATGVWSWLTGSSFGTSGVAIRLTVTYRVA